MKFILLINVKMPTIVGITTFISRVNDWIWGFKPENTIDFGYFNIFNILNSMLRCVEHDKVL